MIKKISLAVALLGTTVMAHADNLNQNIQLSAQQQTVQVILPANTTTGYQWYIQNYDHDLLSAQSYRYAAPSTKALGAGGSAVFLFNIDPRFYDAPQITKLSFVYQQPWNPGQNSSIATVTLSAISSNNDTMEWQKYPSTDTSTDQEAKPSPSTPENGNNWLSLPPTPNSSNS